MSNYGQKAALALSLLILIALSVTEVVLKLASTNFIAEQEGTTFQYTDSSSFEQHLYALPESLHRETINYVVGAGITSIVIAVLALIYLASHVSDPFTVRQVRLHCLYAFVTSTLLTHTSPSAPPPLSPSS
jgi:hypothetical protein